MSKEIKQLLKDARQAFQQKQFKIAEEKCHDILKDDPKNHAAYLILGAIYQEANPSKAIEYLRKAVDYSKDSTLAFQGLMKCAPNDELPNICKEYLEHVPSKYDEVHKKLQLCALSPKTMNACIEILKDEVYSSYDEKRVLSAYKSLVEIYMNVMNVDKCHLQLFRESFEFVIKDRTIVNHDKIYGKYLRILKNLKQLDDLLQCSLEMLLIHPDEYVPLDMICWVYVERYKQSDFCFDDFAPNTIDTYADKVLAMNEINVNALTAKGVYLFETEEYVPARDYLNRGNSNSRTKEFLCLRILGDTHLKLRSFTLAEYCYVTSGTTTSINFFQCLVEQNNLEKSQEALKQINLYLHEATDTEKNLLMEPLIKALIQIKSYDSVDENLQKLATDSELYINLLAYKLMHENQYEKCFELLESNKFATCNYFLLFGECNFNLDKYSNALNATLRATKLEPYNSDCFYWLGKIYLKNGDTERAQKCFEKCVFLNPQHEQSVILLSTIYRQHFEWDLNAKILQVAAQAIPNTSCKWAELQLGFHYLAQNQFDDAISAFRAVLRSDPQNFASWEGLADSYVKRGSFNSALKVYEKICELNENNIYPKLQVANIKTTLKLYKEAIASYDSLLIDRPDYLPALKGIADANLGMANQYLEQRLVGRSKDYAAAAVRFLMRGIGVRSNLICLWRLLANSFDFIASLPASNAYLSVPGALVNENSDEMILLKGDKLYELAARFYCRAIKLNNADISLWYELSLNYYNRAIKYGTSENRKMYLDLAAESAKHTIKEAPLKWKYWNLLGVICTSKDINNLSLAQHCFIKALDIDRKLAVVWTNLGVLYLTQNQEMMANKAFKFAQQSQPSYANAWTGQAQVAEVCLPDEAIDLLLHSISLGYHDESAIQYAYRVCMLLNESEKEKRTKYYVEHLNAIASAIDSITWYCNANDTNLSAEALSYFGYLNNTQQNWRVAVKTFKMAANQTQDSSNRDKMLCNLAFSLLKDNKPIEAVEAFQNVTEATFRSTIGLAHSHFKAKQYEHSYAKYEDALNLLANNDTEKKLILVALASMVYAFQGEDDAKSVLFQCIAETNPPNEALLSACALGILHDDLQLCELALKELKNHERTDLWCHHIAFLTSEFHLKKNDKLKALRYLYSQVHHFPDKPLLRKVLANFLLKNTEKNEKNSVAAYRMVESAIVMQRKMSSMDIAKLLILASEAMRCINPVKSKQLIQKAIHVNPMCKEAWAAKQLVCS